MTLARRIEKLEHQSGVADPDTLIREWLATLSNDELLVLAGGEDDSETKRLLGEYERYRTSQR